MSLLSLEKVSFSYPESSEKKLDDINLELASGSFNVLFGKSGSGKTTLLRQLKPALSPFGKKSGLIRFDGRPLDELNLREQTEKIGFVMQNPDNQIVTDKVWHELAFGLESLGLDQATIRLRVAEMASYFGIQSWFLKDVQELSGGQKQLLNLASIMALHPRLLILDEPTSQLDPIAAGNFLETVAKINREIGTTILISEHRLQEVLPMADQVFLMEKSKIIVNGKPRDVGRMLKETKNDLFIAMPAPMKIYGSCDQGTDYPLTVGEGRSWLEKQTINTEEKTVEVNIPKTPPMIEVKDLWFRYQRTAPDVIKDLSFKVPTGSFYSIVGGNGTGKSTALSLISRIRQPYRGKIKLNGRPLNKFSEDELYHQFLGVLPQNPQSLFVKKTVLDDLFEITDGKQEKKSAAYPLKMSKEAAVAGIVELVHLEQLLDKHPYDLSGGEQQRLALAKVLLLRPKILLLDEPTKGLDDFFKQELGEILLKLKLQGVTILMVSHDVEFVAEFSDVCGLFFDGSLVTTKPAKDFFAGNSFYTTAANRMARGYFPNAVTVKEVIECLNQTQIS
ncbi:ABC transporter ATP-binding protein [Enterococcus xiangfangensis]|uniref:ABC transporter ATP-binding protein n=1 Tax=Enterococcus xiangfangensis TaxID=1296537 RepID=UPI0010F7B9C8|nr:ABC transporter ATP-binding protein [Enterococcus xiangfangensis]MBM7711520.1 energy-coupling factor transport system ATP-binding protein [Enterococcus xiangfangensis]NBK09539.1 ATP-binding cassette domain-containing protein [Enterococcus asini]